jgi:hypothetical protein
MDIAGVYRLLDAYSGLSPQGNPSEPDPSEPSTGLG